MTYRRVPIRTVLATVVAFLGFVAPSAAQSYGPKTQELVVGASSFRGRNADTDHSAIHDDGYLYVSNLSDGQYVAPLDLPEGAVIEQICLYAYDPDLFSEADLHLERVVLAPGGFGPFVSEVPASSTVADFGIGYGVVCRDNIAYVVQSVGDVDGDGNPDHLVHRLKLNVSLSAGFGGARILWHRQVSPAPAVASFNDVPAGSQFSQFVEALHAAGITAGCQASPALYCPDRPITRAEMAVYLSLALGLNWNADVP